MARKPTATMGGASIYQVLTPIQHDLESYDVGDPIALTEDAAEPLLAVNAIRPADAGPALEAE